MGTPYVAIGFFAAAFVAMIAAAAFSFSDVVWSVACGIVSLVFALAGLCVTLWDSKRK